MTVTDIEEIKKIDSLCFKLNEKRTTEAIRAYIAASNNSSLVYVLDNKIIGYNFIHLWGSLGWFGPLGVHPEHQNKGIGKALINETIKFFKENYKVSTIALNTMPESQYNVGFYMGFGFIPHKLSLNLIKQIDKATSLPVSNKCTVDEIDINDSQNYLYIEDNLKNLSNKIDCNFDLSSELSIISNEDFGTIFTLKCNNAVHGIAICYSKQIRETNTKNLQIKLAIIDNTIDYKNAIDALITALSNYSLSIGYKSISIDCNTYNSELCSYLISRHNFKIQKTQLMLTMGQDNPFKNKAALLLTRFAG